VQTSAEKVPVEGVKIIRELDLEVEPKDVIKLYCNVMIKLMDRGLLFIDKETRYVLDRIYSRLRCYEHY
jgi:hypothetical protein